jgi:hypothetical protein
MRVWQRLTSMRPRSRADRERELEREIQSHLALETDESGTTGARRAFGNATLVKEDVRGVWGWAGAGQLARDVIYGLRQVRRHPSFSAMAIVTLALSIGGMSAMFSAFDAILIRPMPYADADRLVMIWDDMGKTDVTARHNATPAEWVEWRRRNTVFTDLASSQPAEATLSGTDEPDQVPARKVSWTFWSVLGVQPALGRVFSEEEDINGVRVALISHGLWQRRFAASPGIVGRTISHHIDQRPVVRGDRCDAASVLFHAVARRRRLDAGVVPRLDAHELLMA